LRWRDRRNGSLSGAALVPVRRSSASSRRRPWIGSGNESGRSRDGLRRQHEDDHGGTGLVYAGPAQRFRILRNAGNADFSHPLGPVAIEGGTVAAVENTASSPGGSLGTWGASAASKQHRWQRARPLVPREAQGPVCRAPMRTSNRSGRHCLTNADVTILEPPYTDAYVRWCGRGRRVTATPMPI